MPAPSSVQAPDAVLAWQEPPPRRRPGTPWRRIVDQVEANPGEWALVYDGKDVHKARQGVRRVLAERNYLHRWEIQQRTVENGRDGRLWIRYQPAPA